MVDELTVLVEPAINNIANRRMISANIALSSTNIKDYRKESKGKKERKIDRNINCYAASATVTTHSE